METQQHFDYRLIVEAVDCVYFPVAYEYNREIENQSNSYVFKLGEKLGKQLCCLQSQEIK